MKPFKFIKHFVFIAIFIALIQSCNVQKRNYNKGFYVSHKKTAVRTHHTVNEDSYTAVRSENFISENKLKSKTAELSNDIASSFLNHKFNPISNHPSDTCGDHIVFNDSSNVAVKIYEITDDKVKYKPCNNLNGPFYLISKNKIAYIQYYNNSKEVFSTTKPSSSASETTCGDAIIFINGNKMKVKILEVTKTLVRYKSCNNQGGVANELSMENVGSLIYSDGTVVNANPIVETPIQKESKASKGVRLLLGVILGLIGLGIISTILISGSGASILIFLYLLFLIFGIGFGYSMGWHQYMPNWIPFMFI